MKFCPLWSLFFNHETECKNEKCGMYKLCNPDYIAVIEEGKKEKKELRVFGGGSIEESKD